jgi:hypothetical protein
MFDEACLSPGVKKCYEDFLLESVFVQLHCSFLQYIRFLRDSDSADELCENHLLEVGIIETNSNSFF